MKKIISALVLGATATALATADISIKANSKLSMFAFKYDSNSTNTKKDADGKKSSKTLFNGLAGYANPQDNVALVAAGDIFTFSATLQPRADNDDVRLKRTTIRAKLGDFFLETGWNRDGTATIKSSGSAGNDEGKLFESYKIGSAFGGDAAFVNNQIAFGKDQPTYFLQAGYNIRLTDDLKLAVSAAALSPHGFNKSKSGEPDKFAARAYNVGWSAFVSPSFKKLFTAEVFAKGYKNKDDKQQLFFGAYVKPTVVSMIKDSAFGGSVYLDDGELEEWNIDLRCVLQLSEKLKLTTLNKLAYKDTATPVAGNVAFATNFTCKQVLWDMVSVEYKLNNTVALTGTVGQQTALKAGDGGVKGTTVYVYPHAQVFASSNASIMTGAALTIDRINMNEYDAKVLVHVPLVVKLTL
ncbi:MAG: hypothetical protein K2M90_08440 [Treponemataceae bacterium]|nr:hypothetical protein [Treponemataceae bacterium]MDE7392468.1 hypothetical protein [Treponemataceae bacterium]